LNLAAARFCGTPRHSGFGCVGVVFLSFTESVAARLLPRGVICSPDFDPTFHLGILMTELALMAAPIRAHMTTPIFLLLHSARWTMCLLVLTTCPLSVALACLTYPAATSWYRDAHTCMRTLARAASTTSCMPGGALIFANVRAYSMGDTCACLLKGSRAHTCCNSRCLYRADMYNAHTQTHTHAHAYFRLLLWTAYFRLLLWTEERN